MLKYLRVLPVLFALGGCAELDFLQKPQDKPNPPPTVSIAPAPAGQRAAQPTNAEMQLWCNTLHDNPLRARELYVGKKIAIAAALDAIQPANAFSDDDVIVSLYATHKTRTRSSDIRISTGVKSDNAALAQFSKGEIIRVSGTVANIRGAGKGCTVSVNNPTFTKISQTAGMSVPQTILQVCERQEKGKPLAIDHARLIFKHDEFGALVFSVHQSDIYVPYDIFVHVAYRVSPRTADKVAAAAQKMARIQTGQDVSIAGVISKTSRSNIVFQTGTGRFVTNWLTSFTTKTPCVIQMVEKI